MLCQLRSFFCSLVDFSVCVLQYFCQIKVSRLFVNNSHIVRVPRPSRSLILIFLFILYEEPNTLQKWITPMSVRSSRKILLPHPHSLRKFVDEKNTVRSLYPICIWEFPNVNDDLCFWRKYLIDTRTRHLRHFRSWHG